MKLNLNQSLTTKNIKIHPIKSDSLQIAGALLLAISLSLLVINLFIVSMILVKIKSDHIQSKGGQLLNQGIINKAATLLEEQTIQFSLPPTQP